MKVMTLLGLLLTLRLAAIGTCAGDVITTRAVLQSGGSEANPLLAGATVPKAIFLDSATVVSAWTLERDHPRIAKVIYIAMIATRGFATVHNAREIR